MTISLKQTSWEGSLLEWIDLASAEYFEPEVLRDYQRWLTDQLEKPANVLPFRLVSGKAPKGTEFVRSDGTILYAADNEPLAGLWGLVTKRGGAPDSDLKELLASEAIPGSWPPKGAPVRFRCRWGPASLRLKDRGMKIAHLIDSGRNAIPIEPEQLARRALLTLSLVNCFPMPNRACVEFSQNGALTDDLAERAEVQSLLLSFVAEHLGGPDHLEPLFAAFGLRPRVEYDPEWRRKAADFRFAIRPGTGKGSTTRAPGRRPTGKRSEKDGPRAFVPSQQLFPDLPAALAELKTWLANHTGVVRLDDRPTSDGNAAPYVRFEVRHLEGTDLVIERPSFDSYLRASDYSGVFRLNGDTKASAIRRLIEMAENGLAIDEILEPDLTALRTIDGRLTGEKPRFILVGSEDAEGLYCYPK